MSYCLLHKLRVSFYTLVELLVTIIERVTSYCLLMSYESLFHTSYELLFIAGVTSYFLTMSYNKDKHDKAANYNKFMIKNYSLALFFDKELGVC